MPFKKGFAHFAVTASAPVVPVGLSGTKDIWLRKRIRVAIGAPIEVGGHSVESLAEAGETAVKALLPAYVEPAGRRPLKRFLTGLF